MTRETLLVVSAVSEDRRAIAEALVAEGREVHAAADARGAWQQIARGQPDLILVDAQLPDADGCAWLAEVRERVPDVDSLVLVEWHDVASFHRANAAGVREIVTKPVELRALPALVWELLTARRLRTRGGARRPAAPVSETGSLLAGGSPCMQGVYRAIGSAARTFAPVLLIGETGTGKELVAREIHDRARCAGPFQAVNLGAVPVSLAESVLFGHVKGAFTNAEHSTKGCFALAAHGSLFLDEIGEATLELQVKLLRVLEERSFRPLGAEREEQFHARVIAATNRRLREMVREGAFQADLYHRLNVLVIELPPLRERKQDLETLANRQLDRALRERLITEVPYVAEDAWEALQSHAWPGNVRELGNVLIAAAHLCRGNVIRSWHLRLEDDAAAEGARGGAQAKRLDRSPIEVISSDGRLMTLAQVEDLEVRLIREALSRHENNIAATARVLGVARQTLQGRMHAHGIRARGPAKDQA